VRVLVAGSAATVVCGPAPDAAMVCGDDVRRMPYAERRRRIELLVTSIATDPEVEMQRPWDPLTAGPIDPYAPAHVQQQKKRPTPEGHDGVRVRLKPEFRLHQVADALQAGRERNEAAEGGGGSAGAAKVGWPCHGLLLFPGHAAPPMPLEPPNEWTKGFSKSQQKEYYFNARTGQSVWSEHRKCRPISFRSSAAALLRWDRRSTALPEAELLRLALEIAEPPAARVW